MSNADNQTTTGMQQGGNMGNNLVRYVITGLFLGLMLATAGCAVHPEVMDARVAAQQAGQDRDFLVRGQEAVTAPLGVEEAMARALKYNRKRAVSLMASVLARARMKQGGFDMWPELAMNAGYTSRSNILASESVSIITSSQSLEPSTSTDDQRRVADISFAWNILDFGLSYVRAGQNADRFLMAREEERKAIQTLIADVRQAYWEALAAQRLMHQINPLARKVASALEQSRQVEGRKLEDPMKSLGYQRELLNMRLGLAALKRRFMGARSRLASLMGLVPGTLFTLVDTADHTLYPLDLDMDTLELQALARRPELMGARYQGRIAKNETRATLLELLPGISLDAGLNWDSNSYLVNQNWAAGGAHIGWNLFKVFRYPGDQALNKARESYTRAQQLALSMGVLMQVHLARVEMIQARKRFELARDYLDVETRILNHMRASTGVRRMGGQELIRVELNHLLAQVKQDLAWADVQASYGRFDASVGRDPVPENTDALSVSDLARALARNMMAWTGTKKQ